MHRVVANRTLVVLSLVICVTALVLAVALYGITRDEDRDVAALALCFRVGEGLLAATPTGFSARCGARRASKARPAKSEVPDAVVPSAVACT